MSTTDHLSKTLSALADPTRRGIIARLAMGDATVNEIAEPYAMSRAAVSKHLKVLEGAGLISKGRESQWRPCHLEGAPLRDVSAWLDEYRKFWDRSLDALESYLEKIQATGAPSSSNVPSRAGREKRAAKRVTKRKRNDQ